MSNDGNAAATRRKALAAGFIGNIVEWYDFALYGYLATTLAHVFFPKSDTTAALLSTFGIFALSLLIRPVGAVVLGNLGDRIGRRPSLILAVSLMSGSTIALGLLPTSAQIGDVAVVLLILLRLVQGFSAGGEYSGSAVFVIEHASPSRRGRYASFVFVSCAAGTMCGIVAALITTTATTPEQLVSWGWRVPFLAAAPLALIGLYLRLRVDESPEFAALRNAGQVESSPVRQALKVAKKPMLILIGWAMANAVAAYLFSGFLVSHLEVTGNFSNTQALVVQLVAYLVVIAGSLVAGRVIDRIGRKRVAVAAAIGLGAWSIPTFMLIADSSLLGACLIAGLFAVLWSAVGTSTALALVELFPARVRSSAGGLAYNIAYALFGGTAPFVATWFVGRGLPVAPGYYLSALCVVAAIAAALGIGNRARSKRDDNVDDERGREIVDHETAQFTP
ncbi:MFS transporter [Rhodococcus koreensis]|uniref:MFS transporter n=1 Tax=Rhodococcus koreensis TaxID=99653 RepID=UPI00366F7533